MSRFRLVVVPKYLEDKLSPALCVESTINLDEHLYAVAAVVIRVKDAAARALVAENEMRAEILKRQIAERSF